MTKSRDWQAYSVIQQTDGRYAVWDNAMDWFAGMGEYADLSYEKAIEAAKMLNDKVDESE